MDAITELALESISIKEGHKELEILVLTVVRRSCKQ